MDIAIFTIAFNGYEKYVPQWCEAIAKMTVQPKEILLGLPMEHSATKEALVNAYAKFGYRFTKVHIEGTIGDMRNRVVEQSTSEWLMCIDVDDIVLPKAIELMGAREQDADVIVPAYVVECPITGAQKYTYPNIPRTTNILDYRCNGYFTTASNAFRRKFWEKRRFVSYKHPNIPHIMGLVKDEARFVVEPKPCFIYKRHTRSLSWGRSKREEKKIYIKLDKYAKEINDS